MIKVDLHCHTKYSYDSEIDPQKLIEACREKGIGRLAITDHDVIDGALEMKKRAPELIIVGEEVKSKSGDIIGLFLKEWIPPRLTAQETVDRIKEQGGLVYIPHAFDQFRAGIGKEGLDSIRDKIDIIETFNAKTFIPAFDKKALAYATQYNIPMASGSDTHQLFSLGNTYNEIQDYKTPQELVENLKSANYRKKRTGIAVYASSGVSVIKSLLKK